MPQISIIVPHQGDASSFERTLVSVLEHRPVDAEIIVPHCGYDDPYNLQDEVTFVEVARKSKKGNFLQAAMSQANSNILHLLCDGVQVTDGWCDWAIAHFQDPYVGCVVPLVVDCDDVDQEEIIHAGLRADFVMRRKLIGRGVTNPKKLRLLDPIGPTSSAAFYRKSALAQIQELLLPGDSQFDLQLAMSLSELGFESKLETDCKIVWDEEMVESASPIRSGRDMQRTVLSFAGIDGMLKSALVTSTALATELLSAPVQPSNLLRMFGRMIGLVDSGRCRQLRSAMQDAAGPLEEQVLNIESARTRERQDSTAVRRAA